VRLSVVLGREYSGVDKNKNNDKPVEPLRLERLTNGLTTPARPLEDTLPARQDKSRQEAQLSPSDSAMRRVS